MQAVYISWVEMIFKPAIFLKCSVLRVVTLNSLVKAIAPIRVSLRPLVDLSLPVQQKYDLLFEQTLVLAAKSEVYLVVSWLLELFFWVS